MEKESYKARLFKALEEYDDNDIIIKKLYIYFLRLVKTIRRE